ncbi:MAG: hypothetical protein ACLUVG_09800, partial [Phocaeicola vulgatus]
MTIVVHNLFQYLPQKKLTFFKKNNPERRKNIGTLPHKARGCIQARPHESLLQAKCRCLLSQVDEFYSTSLDSMVRSQVLKKSCRLCVNF